MKDIFVKKRFFTKIFYRNIKQNRILKTGLTFDDFTEGFGGVCVVNSFEGHSGTDFKIRKGIAFALLSLKKSE